MKIKRFEDLQIWKESRCFAKEIYLLCNRDRFCKDFGLKDQIQRAAVSIIANIAEGFERDNNKEFIKFLLYAKGSVGEVRSLLYLASDLNYINQQEFQNAHEASISIIKQISNFIKYLKTFINK